MEKIKFPFEYNRHEYESDLRNIDFPHIKSEERFATFYEELGKDSEEYKNLTYFPDRYFFIEPKGKILELGCHFGYNMFHWAKQGFTCVGVDISSSLIEYGMEKLEELPQEVRERVTFCRSWIENFNWPEKFDTIVITETLEHVIDPLLILKKAREYIKDDGRIYIAVPETRWGNSSHVRGIDIQQMEQLLEQSGLAPIKWFKLTNPEETALIARKI